MLRIGHAAVGGLALQPASDDGQAGTANHEAYNRVLGQPGECRLDFFGGSFDDSGWYRHCFVPRLLNQIIFLMEILRQ